MQASHESPETPESKSKFSPITLGITLVVAIAILLSLWFLFQPFQNQKSSAGSETVVLNMNSAEQESAKKIEVAKIEMSRAENFLHQEVTTLAAELYNGGAQPVLGITLTAEFFDDMNQVVLRETRKVLAPPAPALAPGERRSVEISFEHIPDSWNRQAPVVRVSRLQLAPLKQ